MVKEKRIAAGAHSFKSFFENTAAHHVGNSYCAYKRNTPPPTFFTVVQYNESPYEKIKWCPENRITEVGKYDIKKGIGPSAVQLYKQPFIPYIQLFPEC
jgi:hypothetical protein